MVVLGNGQAPRSNSGPCRILRLAEQHQLISADIFEQNFAQACAAWAEICYAHPREWLQQLLVVTDKGPGVACKRVAARFAEITCGYDYISPGYNGFHLLPLVALLRAEQGARLLFIAHAPVQHVVELSLVRDLLRPGDVIVCPSVNARQILCAFHTSFAPYTVVIPHCTQPLPCPATATPSATRPRKVVSLGRITADKLIHRQIDALALLRQQGVEDVVMEIAGPCEDASGRTLAYINELRARIGRLGLEQWVTFTGTLRTPEERGTFLNGAAVCINLSRAEEESFGKSCAEAVTMGTPVIVTRWNGLPETVGKCGAIIPCTRIEGGRVFDVDPADCARALIQLLQQPPLPADFISQRQLFAPAGSGAAYRTILLRPTTLADDLPTNGGGPDLLALIPAIRAFAPGESRALYLAALGIQTDAYSSAEELRRAAQGWTLLADLIFNSVRAGGRQLLAHQQPSAPAPPLAQALEEMPVCAELLDGEMRRRLLADCLLESDPWARDLTLTRLTARSPSLTVWSEKILHSQQGFTGFVLEAEVNRLLAGGEALAAAQAVKTYLAASTPGENDADLMRYFLAICQQAGCVKNMTDILHPWLERFPDAPGCSLLWPVLAINLIVHDQQYHQGQKALAQIERLIPEFDTAKLRAALTALASI